MQPQEIQKKKLPTLQELHLAPTEAYKNDQLNLLLNQPCHSSWVKKHPIYKNDYLPIDKVEWLITRIFQQWRVEVLDYKVILNSVTISIRLHYHNPVTGEWSYHDGVGAHEMQVNKDANPMDVTQAKGNAVMLALPIAKSRAIRDAADHLGRLFGRDLNRKDYIAFQPAYQNETQPKTEFNNL